MEVWKKDNIVIKRFKKGMAIIVREPMGFSSSIALTEEEMLIIKEYFLKEGIK